MLRFEPMPIPGRWQEGFTLDYHTVRSNLAGDDGYGNPQFETVRTEVGEQLYRLKYRSDKDAVPLLVEAAASYFEQWRPDAELIVPVPSSRKRDVPPVVVLAESLGARLGLPVCEQCVIRTREVPEVKNVSHFGERTRLLAGAHGVMRERVEGKRVLVFDDLYRSGATLSAVAHALYDDGDADEVFALTLTRTRSGK